jgi:hypothetical protein
VSRLARDITQTVEAIASHLAKNKDIMLVVLDTFAKVLRARNSGDYDEMLTLCEQLHLLARETGVHIQALAHCKKIQHDDPFDNLLGSVEVRAETDTNIVIYDHRGRRLIKSETRMGIPWDDPIELHADVEIVGKSKLVSRFYLGNTLREVKEQKVRAQEKNTRTAIKSGIISLLKENGGEMPMSLCIDGVFWRKESKDEVRDELIADGVIEMRGAPHSKTNPLRLRLLKPDWSEGLIVASSALPNPGSLTELIPEQVPEPTHEPTLLERLQQAENQLAEYEAARVKTMEKFNNDGGWGESVRRQQKIIADLEREIAATEVGKEQPCVN